MAPKRCSPGGSESYLEPCFFFAQAQSFPQLHLPPLSHPQLILATCVTFHIVLLPAHTPVAPQWLQAGCHSDAVLGAMFPTRSCWVAVEAARSPTGGAPARAGGTGTDALYRARNARRALFAAPGSSRLARWPAPGITSRRAPGMAAAIVAASLGGVSGRPARPTSTRVGTAIVGRVSRESARAGRGRGARSRCPAARWRGCARAGSRRAPAARGGSSRPRASAGTASTAAEAPSASTFEARVARFAFASAVSAPARVSRSTSPASRCGWRRTKAKAA